MEDEIYLFIFNDNSHLAQEFDDQTWACKVSYLANFFALVNELNTQMQAHDSDMISLQYEMEGLLLKVGYWIHLQRMYQFDAFPLLKAHSASYPPYAYSLDLFTTHLHEMKLLIREYFPPLRE